MSVDGEDVTEFCRHAGTDRCKAASVNVALPYTCTNSRPALSTDVSHVALDKTANGSETASGLCDILVRFAFFLEQRYRSEKSLQFDRMLIVGKCQYILVTS